MFDEKTVAVLKVRAKVLQAARFWLDQNGYFGVQGPTLVPAVGEWPSHFEVKYFDKKAYLAQGLQPYADVFVSGLGKIRAKKRTGVCSKHQRQLAHAIKRARHIGLLSATTK